MNDSFEYSLLTYYDYLLRRKQARSLTSLLLRFGNLKDRALLQKSFADGTVLLSCLQAATDGLFHERLAPRMASFKPSPRKASHRLKNTQEVFRLINSAFQGEGWPPVEQQFSASAISQGEVTRECVLDLLFFVFLGSALARRPTTAKKTLAGLRTCCAKELAQRLGERGASPGACASAQKRLKTTGVILLEDALLLAGAKASCTDRAQRAAADVAIPTEERHFALCDATERNLKMPAVLLRSDPDALTVGKISLVFIVALEQCICGRLPLVTMEDEDEGADMTMQSVKEGLVAEENIAMVGPPPQNDGCVTVTVSVNAVTAEGRAAMENGQGPSDPDGRIWWPSSGSRNPESGSVAKGPPSPGKLLGKGATLEINCARDIPISWVLSEVLRQLDEAKPFFSGELKGAFLEVIGLRRDIDRRYLGLESEVQHLLNGFNTTLTLMADVVQHSGDVVVPSPEQSVSSLSTASSLKETVKKSKKKRREAKSQSPSKHSPSHSPMVQPVSVDSPGAVRKNLDHEKFTFESWINVRLLGRGVYIQDLFNDLRSGVILAHLAEVLSGRRLSALDRELNREQIGEIIKTAAGSAAQTFKAGTQRLKRTLRGGRNRTGRSQSEGRPHDSDAESWSGMDRKTEIQSNAFRRMVIVLKFLRVVIDSIELQQFATTQRDQFARFPISQATSPDVPASKDAFQWGPLTLSSITPISIVNGDMAKTCQLLRTIMVYFTPARWCHDGAFGLGGLRGTILVWINRHISRSFAPICDLTRSLRDGIVVLTLLRSLNPDEIQPLGEIDDERENKAPQYRRPAPSPQGEMEKWHQNWKRAVIQANHVMGVPRLINTESTEFWNNECCMIIYLAELMFRSSRCHHITPLAEKPEENQIATSQLETLHAVATPVMRSCRDSNLSSLPSSVTSSFVDGVEERETQRREITQLRRAVKALEAAVKGKTKALAASKDEIRMIEERVTEEENISKTNTTKSVMSPVKELQVENAVLADRIKGLMRYHAHVHQRLRDTDNKTKEQLEWSLRSTEREVADLKKALATKDIEVSKARADKGHALTAVNEAKGAKEEALRLTKELHDVQLDVAKRSVDISDLEAALALEHAKTTALEEDLAKQETLVATATSNDAEVLSALSRAKQADEAAADAKREAGKANEEVKAKLAEIAALKATQIKTFTPPASVGDELSITKLVRMEDLVMKNRALQSENDVLKFLSDADGDHLDSTRKRMLRRFKLRIKAAHAAGKAEGEAQNSRLRLEVEILKHAHQASASQKLALAMLFGRHPTTFHNEDSLELSLVVSERDDAMRSVQRSGEAMQRLLKGATAMRSFFTKKVNELEHVLATNAIPSPPPANVATAQPISLTSLDAADGGDSDEVALAHAESEEVAEELEKLTEQHETVLRRLHQLERREGTKSVDEGVTTTDLFIENAPEVAVPGETTPRQSQSVHTMTDHAYSTCDGDSKALVVAGLRQQLESAQSEIAALRAATGVSVPGKLQMLESLERASAQVTLDEAQAGISGPRKHDWEVEKMPVKTSIIVDDEFGYVRQMDTADRPAPPSPTDDTIDSLEYDNHEARTLELKQNIQDAIATTMCFLKGQCLLLRPSDKAFLSRAIASCAAGFELRLFREAHLCIKRSILEVAGEQSSQYRRWVVPPEALQKIGSKQRHELLKQIRLLIVSFDNMDTFAKEKLATSAEVLANLDILIEIGRACLKAEDQRRKEAPRALRPSMFGAPPQEYSQEAQYDPTFAVRSKRAELRQSAASVRKGLKQRVVGTDTPIAPTRVTSLNSAKEQLAEAREEIAALSEDYSVPSYLSAGLNAISGIKAPPKKEKKDARAPWM